MKKVVHGLEAKAIANLTAMARERPNEILLFTANQNRTVDRALTIIHGMDSLVDDMSDTVLAAVKPIKDKVPWDSDIKLKENLNQSATVNVLETVKTRLKVQGIQPYPRA